MGQKLTPCPPIEFVRFVPIADVDQGSIFTRRQSPTRAAASWRAISVFGTARPRPRLWLPLDDQQFSSERGQRRSLLLQRKFVVRVDKFPVRPVGNFAANPLGMLA